MQASGNQSPSHTLIAKLSSLDRCRYEGLKQVIGTISDKKLSEQSGLSPHVIFNLREKLGIPSSQMRKAILPEEALELLGKAPDVLIAEQFNIDRQTVTHQRKRLGIARFKPGIASAPLIYKALYLESIDTLAKLLEAHGITPSAYHDSRLQQASELSALLGHNRRPRHAATKATEGYA